MHFLSFLSASAARRVRTLLLTAGLLGIIWPAPVRIAQGQQNAPAPQTGTEHASAQAVLATADDVLKQMSGITGLPIKAPLKKELVSKTGVERYLKDNLNAEYTPAEMHGEEAALKAFGVVGPSFNLEKFLVTFYTEQAAGFYDPRRQTMFMADWVEPDQQKIVLAHELTHALQDQSFDLWKFIHSVRDNDDAMSARDALVEGYATLSMMQVALGSLPVEKLPSLDTMMEEGVRQSMSGYPVFSSAPFFLRYQMLFPYVQGMRFSLHVLELGGWKRLNEVFLDPPRTTKEIFKPSLYLGSTTAAPAAGSAPPPLDAAGIDLPNPPPLDHAAGMHQVENNVMGALGYYALFGQLLTDEESRKVSSAWMADRYEIYEGPASGQFTLVSRTRWTSPKAADDFCTDYKTILLSRWVRSGLSKEDHRPADGSGSAKVLFRNAGPRRALLVEQGDECRWYEGAPAQQADALARWIESLR